MQGDLFLPLLTTPIPQQLGIIVFCLLFKGQPNDMSWIFLVCKLLLSGVLASFSIYCFAFHASMLNYPYISCTTGNLWIHRTTALKRVYWCFVLGITHLPSQDISRLTAQKPSCSCQGNLFLSLVFKPQIAWISCFALHHSLLLMYILQ